jgi:hypothetical protein
LLKFTEGNTGRIKEYRGGGMKKIRIVFLLFGLIMFFGNPRPGLCMIRDTRSVEGELGTVKDESISRILLVLGDRVDDQKLRGKTIDKLITLNDEKIQLISSLCDKIAMNRNSAGSDIAFSLVSIIIILS